MRDNKERCREYYKKHKEESLKRCQDWYNSHPGWNKIYRLKNLSKIKTRELRRAYGITFEDQVKIINLQGGICPICKIVLKNVKQNVDHNHITGKVRGILCHACNALIGFSREDRLILENAIKYLEGGE